MSSGPVNLIQISDLHSFGNDHDVLLGVNTDQSFQALLNLIKKNPKQPELIVLSGDMAQEPIKQTYQRIADQVSELNIPVYFVPGNHDEPQIMASVFPRGRVSTQRSIVLNQWQIILLNSHKPMTIAGYLSQDEFDFLHESLEDYPEHYATIVFHHHPMPIGCPWIDNNPLINSNELWEFLKGYPQVRLILFGHIHQEHAGKKNGIHYYSSPSSCFQFKPGAKEFSLDPLPPGYRWVDLYPNGEFKTGIQRLPEYIGIFEQKATGY